ncbi:MAG: hypothetical protein RL001_1323 [Pseudomonadota bacterium]|jgi:hypothetical protein|nr:hypothetical protein [Oxalobacteraceae bacterium]
MRPQSANWFINKNMADFITKEQHQALLTEDEKSLQQADDRALAEAILASLAEESRAGRARAANSDLSPADSSWQESTDVGSEGLASTTITPSESHYEASRQINQQLASWFDHHGFQVVHNSGKDENCLLISMAQHAAENYDTEHFDQVSSLRKMAKDYTKKTHPNTASMNDYSLFSDGKFMNHLVKEINDSILNQQRKLTFWIATADLAGQPAWRKVGDGPRMAIIFDQGGHYEAVIPKEIAAASQTPSQPPR